MILKFLRLLFEALSKPVCRERSCLPKQAVIHTDSVSWAGQQVVQAIHDFKLESTHSHDRPTLFVDTRTYDFVT